MKRLTDPTFAYMNAADTSKPGYLAAKFAKIRRELKAQAEAEAAAKAEQTVKVRELRKASK